MPEICRFTICAALIAAGCGAEDSFFLPDSSSELVDVGSRVHDMGLDRPDVVGVPSDVGVPEPDGGPSDANSDTGIDATPDAGVDAGPRTGLVIIKEDGSPASGALIYSMEQGVGELLGRADSNGYFALTSSVSFLARHNFDKVALNEYNGSGVQDVLLEPTADHPETLTLRGVGMEMEFSTSTVSRVWEREGGGFRFTETTTTVHSLWEWTVDSGSQQIMDLPMPAVGVYDAATELGDGLLLLIAESSSVTGTRSAMIVDLGAKTTADLTGIRPSALDDVVGPRAVHRSGDIFIFEAGGPITVHRFNRATGTILESSLSQSSDVVQHVGFIDGHALIATDDWFLLVDLDLMVARELPVGAPGELLPRSAVYDNGELRAATIQSPLIHWWSTASGGYVTFDVGPFLSAEAIAAPGQRPGLFAAVRDGSLGGRNFWLDAQTQQSFLLAELNRLSLTLVAWYRPVVRGQTIIATRQWFDGLIRPLRIEVDGANRVTTFFSPIVYPDWCGRAYQHARYPHENLEYPLAALCSELDGTDSHVSTEHGAQKLRRTLFGDQGLPFTVGKEGRVAFRKSPQSRRNIILDPTVPN